MGAYFKGRVSIGDALEPEEPFELDPLNIIEEREGRGWALCERGK